MPLFVKLPVEVIRVVCAFLGMQRRECANTEMLSFGELFARMSARLEGDSGGVVNFRSPFMRCNVHPHAFVSEMANTNYEPFAPAFLEQTCAAIGAFVHESRVSIYASMYLFNVARDGKRGVIVSLNQAFLKRHCPTEQSMPGWYVDVDESHRPAQFGEFMTALRASIAGVSYVKIRFAHLSLDYDPYLSLSPQDVRDLFLLYVLSSQSPDDTAAPVTSVVRFEDWSTNFAVVCTDTDVAAFPILRPLVKHTVDFADNPTGPVSYLRRLFSF